MATETYNGWTNYESWLVALWLDSEQGSQERAREIAAEAESDLAAGERIKADIEGDMETIECSSGMMTDLINAALSRVDWREVGHHFRSE